MNFGQKYFLKILFLNYNKITKTEDKKLKKMIKTQ